MGGKGDLMIPKYRMYLREPADNYPFKMNLRSRHFLRLWLKESILVDVTDWELPFRIRTILNLFLWSLLHAVGFGNRKVRNYQKADTVPASKIRRSIRSNVKSIVCILCFG